MRLLLLLLLTLPLLSLPFSLLRSPLVSTRSSPPLFLFTNFPASAANTSSPLPDVASFSQELQIAASKFTNAFFETPASVCDPVTTNCTTNTTDSLINKDLQKAINAYRQNAGVGRLAGNTSTTDADIYKALKDNVLSSPDTLLRSIKKDDDEEVSDVEILYAGNATRRASPSTTLTPSDVIVAILDSLRQIDTPKLNAGVEVLFSFTSPASSSVGSSVEDFREYMEQTKYSTLIHHHERIFDKKVTYSTDKRKAYLDVRLKDGRSGEWKVASFVLSSRERSVGLSVMGEVWLLDSMLVKEK